MRLSVFSGDKARSSFLRLSGGVGLVACLGLAGYAGQAVWRGSATPPPPAASEAVPLVKAPAIAPQASLLDPRPVVAPAPAAPEVPSPLTAKLAAVTAPAAQPVKPPREAAAPLPITPAAPRLAKAPPLPVPRPADLKPAEATPRVATRRGPRRARLAAAAVPQEDNRSFWEKLLGLEPSPTPPPALSYAALDAAPLRVVPERRASPAPTAQAGVAVYDISAGTLTLPSGERLEAHSGLGDKRDDPAYAHIRMKGVTPPGTYDLTERERLFHGVRAIRLNPVGGSAAVHGRSGLLAHTYLLGPDGDSNGCISLRDYDRFLRAFLEGEIGRVVVVAGAKGDALAPVAGRRMPSAARAS